MARKPRPNTEPEALAEERISDEAPDQTPAEDAAPEVAAEPDPEHVPVNAGIGGRFVMKNGRRIKRTD